MFMLLFTPAIIVALSFHEAAHGWMANKLGDPTAKAMGRITLNPAKHLDPIGTLMMFFIGIGFAKPVPVNHFNFKNPRKGMALVALAGPVSNLLLSAVGLIMYWVTGAIFLRTGLIGALETENVIGNIPQATLTLLFVFAAINAMLAFFNLMPVPPLDGSRVAFMGLSHENQFKLRQHERTIWLVFMVGMVFFPNIVLWPVHTLTNLFLLGVSTPIVMLLNFLGF